MAEKITVKAKINAPIDKVWEYYNDPKYVMEWNSASEDWYTPSAESNFEVGGTFTYRMEARDGSAGFDMTGTFDEIQGNQYVAYTMSDGRKVEINFDGDESTTNVEVIFDAETENSIEMQQEGWQGILDNFKNYVENN